MSASFESQIVHAHPGSGPVAAANCQKSVVPCNPALLSLSRAKRVLLLQGPLGPFFDRLTVWLRTRGVQVERVALQGGDEHDSRASVPIAYTGTPANWADFFRNLLQAGSFDHLVLFGQARFYHMIALREARAMGVCAVVMEEGYFRPGFATMELDGVNGYSTTMDRFEWRPECDDATHRNLPLKGPLQPQDSANHFRKMAWFASQHYLAMERSAGKFPHYIHHKECNPYWYARYWVWSWAKKYWYRGRDERAFARLRSRPSRYYLVALQHDGDSQITHHSRFRENTNFIIEVMRSFSLHAPADALLVFRQHPYCRGGAGHVGLVRALAQELGLGRRVVHFVEGDTPVMVQHSAGVVLINSTVGLQALELGVPLIAQGDALYGREGLTFQHGLDRFWSEGRPADPQVRAEFMPQLKNLTQVPVSLYALSTEPLTWA